MGKEYEFDDINWAVSFEITENGEEVNFWDLSENEQESILTAIENDSYSGTFIGDWNADEEGE